MRADRVEFAWDENKSRWLVRIQTGEEVIQRHSDLPKSVDEATLRAAVEKVVVDEGYEIDPESVVLGQAQKT